MLISLVNSKKNTEKNSLLDMLLFDAFDGS